MNETNSERQETVKCVSCERTILRYVATEKDGKYYCCPECAEGKTCDCQ